MTRFRAYLTRWFRLRRDRRDKARAEKRKRQIASDLVAVHMIGNNNRSALR